MLIKNRRKKILNDYIMIYYVIPLRDLNIQLKIDAFLY